MGRMVRGRAEHTENVIGNEVGEEGNDPTAGGVIYFKC